VGDGSWKEIKDVNDTKAYTTNDENFWRIMNASYSSPINFYCNEYYKVNIMLKVKSSMRVLTPRNKDV
jgi:hypothetical protein